MNEPHDPDEWEQEPHPLAITIIKVIYYAMYCVVIYQYLR